MNTRGDIEKAIHGIIREHLNADAEEITQAATLDDLGADSLDKVELIMAAEEQFEIMITDEAAETIVTVRDFFNVVEACLGQ